MPRASTKTTGVTFDKAGRLIVTDPGIARKIATWVSARRGVELIVTDGGTDLGPAPAPAPVPVKVQPPLATCPNTFCPYHWSGRIKLTRVVNPGPQIPSPAVRKDGRKPGIIK